MPQNTFHDFSQDIRWKFKLSLRNNTWKLGMHNPCLLSNSKFTVVTWNLACSLLILGGWNLFLIFIWIMLNGSMLYYSLKYLCEVTFFWECNRPIIQIQQCIRQISQNWPFCITNVQTWAHLCKKNGMVHYGMCYWCIVGFVPQVYSDLGQLHWMIKYPHTRQSTLVDIFAVYTNIVSWILYRLLIVLFCCSD